jgi:hypothetical protein
VHLDFAAKTVCLTVKSIAKTNASWQNRFAWSWRQFAAHIGMLFWAWGILRLNPGDYYPVLRFVTQMGVRMHQHPEEWDTPAVIWPSVWTPLREWTEQVLRNTPRSVPKRCDAEWLVVTDASRWGWGYLALHTASGDVRAHSQAWDAETVRRYRDKLGHSSFAEPRAITNAMCHLLTASDRKVRIASDSIVAVASGRRGFNTHSYWVNDTVNKLHNSFPFVEFEWLHVPGRHNIADGRSRGLSASAATGQEASDISEWLRLHVGQGVPFGDSSGSSAVPRAEPL